MTDEELKNDRAIIEAAIDAPWTLHQKGSLRWVVEDGNGMWVASCGNDEASAKAIAAARVRWPVALAEIERLKLEDRAALDARNILGAALMLADGEHSSSLIDCANRAAELVAENKQLRDRPWERLRELGFEVNDATETNSGLLAEVERLQKLEWQTGMAHVKAFASKSAECDALRVEVVRLRAELARWEAIGERHDLKLREPGCKCDREEGDSPCPVHELWALCQEPPTGVGETGCRWIGKMSNLIDRDGIKHCPNCNSTAIVEDLEEDRAGV